MPPVTRARCASGSPSSASYSHHPPPPVGFGSPPYSASYSHHPSPPAPPPDRFGFILAESGGISPSQDALLRSSPFIRQEKEKEMEKPPAAAAAAADIRGLTSRILYGVFGSESPRPSSRRRRYSDSAAGELALVDYFLRLGPGRLHLLRPRQPQDGEQAGRTPLPSAPPEAAKERPDGVPPPAERCPSRLLDAAAAIPTTSSEAGKEKAAALKRGRPDSSHPSCVSFSIADERSSKSKRPCVPPSAANHTGGTCSLDAGVGHIPAVAGGPPLADDGGRRVRKLPPSILCPSNWEQGGVGDGGDTRVRHGQPSLQVEWEAGGEAPAAGAAAHAPRVSSPVRRSLPAENTTTVPSADATDAEKRGSDKGDADEPGSPSLTAVVEETPPSRVGGGATSLSTFIDCLLRYSRNPIQTPEDVDLLEALATKGIQLPRPRWWRPGGYDRPSSPMGN